MDDSERARSAINSVLTRRGLRTLDENGFGHSFRLPMTDWFDDLGVAVDEHELAASEWNTVVASQTAPIRDGFPGLARRIRATGARLAVVSAAGSRAVHADMRSHQVRQLIDIVVTDANDKAASLRELKANSAVALYVGDTTHDMEAAHAAGFEAIGISGGYSQPRSLLRAADRVIQRLSELEQIVLDVMSQVDKPTP